MKNSLGFREKGNNTKLNPDNLNIPNEFIDSDENGMIFEHKKQIFNEAKKKNIDSSANSNEKKNIEKINDYNNLIVKGLQKNNISDNHIINPTKNSINLNNLLILLENKEKEINDYKSKIQQYEKEINFLVESNNTEKKKLENEISELKSKTKIFEKDYKDLKFELEKEKNKNAININKLNEDNNNYGKIGIKNNDNNCYMSSVIQIIKNIKNFGKEILSYDKNDEITNSFRKVLHNLYYSNEKYISIYEFKNNFSSLYNKFSGNRQNDSALFLMYLLNHLKKVFTVQKQQTNKINSFQDLKFSSLEKKELDIFLNKHENNGDSYINNLFYGYQMNKYICSKCEYNRVSFQIFNLLDLPIVTENVKVKCLEQSLNTYLITKDNHDNPGFDCSNCGGKYLSFLACIIKLPKILIINLRRVGENTVYYHDIEIPQILETKFIDKLKFHNKKYELIGFIKHFGNEKNGHNIAFSKNIFDNKWYSFNDEIVKEEKEFPSTDKSFLLFYQNIIK